MAAKGPADKLMRISAAAKAAGVSKQTIDYYVMLGLIEPIRHADRPARYFDDALVRRIRLVRRLNESGYTLRDIRETYLDKPAGGRRERRRSRRSP
jgi:DNA-binding transcriptional MerR regulator